MKALHFKAYGSKYLAQFGRFCDNRQIFGEPIIRNDHLQEKFGGKDKGFSKCDFSHISLKKYPDMRGKFFRFFERNVILKSAKIEPGDFNFVDKNSQWQTHVEDSMLIVM